jgi:alkanesulfonate monooxygenase SsuD/methylene tetrahydromethanopterin reductase-like flavin-dependent oxidoreductase (luciferase family)
MARFARESALPLERARQIAVAGSPSEIADYLTRYVDIGFDMFLLMERSPLDFETLRLFMHQVGPQLRERR